MIAALVVCLSVIVLGIAAIVWIDVSEERRYRREMDRYDE